MRFVRDINVKGDINSRFEKFSSAAVLTNAIDVEEPKKGLNIEALNDPNVAVDTVPELADVERCNNEEPIDNVVAPPEEIIDEPIDVAQEGECAVEGDKLEERFAIPDFGFEKLTKQANFEEAEEGCLETDSVDCKVSNEEEAISEPTNNEVVEDEFAPPLMPEPEIEPNIQKPYIPEPISDSEIFDEPINEEERKELIAEGNKELSASDTWNSFVDNVIVPTLGVCVDKLKEFIMTKLVDDLKNIKGE